MDDRHSCIISLYGIYIAETIINRKPYEAERELSIEDLMEGIVLLRSLYSSSGQFYSPKHDLVGELYQKVKCPSYQGPYHRHNVW